jgi:hypothetical protein
MRARDKNGTADGRGDAGGSVGGSWPERMLRCSFPASVLAARRSHIATFPPHTGVAAEMTNRKGTEECFRAREKEKRTAAYASGSESSVSRLLATLLCRPSESSL